VIRFLLLAILILLIARTFWKVVDGMLEAAGGTTRQRAKSRGPAPVKLVKDPVCGTWVPPEEQLSAIADGSTYYFCSERCREAFGTTRAAGGQR